MNPPNLYRLNALRVENEQRAERHDEVRHRFDKLRTRHEDGTAPRAVTAFQLFQTPKDIARRMAATLPEHEAPRILEPSAGLGRLLEASRERYPAATITAVEESPDLTAELFKQDRKGVDLLQRDFLSVNPHDLEPFDFVVMNPPFHMRADIKHIEHALKFLKVGGVLTALCMNTPHREKALRPLTDAWQVLPAGTFGREGTRIETVLLTIHKPE